MSTEAGHPGRHMRWVWLLAVLVLIVPIVAILGPGRAELGADAAATAGNLVYLLVGPVYVFVAALIVTRQSKNTVGWMMMAIGVGFAIGILAEILIPAEPSGDVGVGAFLLIALGSASWIFFIFPLFHLLLTFPTGRVLSSRWRVFVWLEIAMVGVFFAVATFSEVITTGDGSWSVPNPIGFIPETFSGAVFGIWWNAGLLILTVAGLAAVVLRFRRSRGVERQQLKLLLFAVVLWTVVYGGAAALSGSGDSTWLDVLLPVAMMGIGVAVAVAVLRFRLYDLDRVVSRTVSYAVVVGVLAGAVALTATLVSTRFDDPLIVAATTLGVAAVFNPLRRRVQRVVDRRFNRSRYDAQRVAGEFATSLRDQVDPDALVNGWVGAVTETMQPSGVGVWVRG